MNGAVVRRGSTVGIVTRLGLYEKESRVVFPPAFTLPHTYFYSPGDSGGFNPMPVC